MRVVVSWIVPGEVLRERAQEIGMTTGAPVVVKPASGDPSVAIARAERVTRRSAAQGTPRAGVRNARRGVHRIQLGKEQSRSEIVRSPLLDGHWIPNAGSSYRTPRAASGT